VGPTVRDGAIGYDDIESTADLTIGWTDEQDEPDGATLTAAVRYEVAEVGGGACPPALISCSEPRATPLIRALRGREGALE
jgi:hypothetical protein